MPTIKRKNWVPILHPSDLKPDEDVFYYKLTNEIFKSYKDYAARMEEYRLKQWSCKFSGKSGLTFREALLEERKSEDLLKEAS